MPQRDRRSPGPAAALGTVTGALLLVATAACSAESPPEQPTAEPEATGESTPLDDYDTAEVAIVRSDFCERVSDDAITAAIGDEAADLQAWQPGERLPDSRDIGNEFGCAWTAGSVSARAWVFAPPITPQRADDLASEVVGPTCKPLRPAAPLGDPGGAQSCVLDTDARRVGFFGLIGDAWVNCEVTGLTGPGAEADDLVGQWCVAVLEALRSA
jgi:hypothetical protein